MAAYAREIDVTALENTHALDMQVLQIMERYVERPQHDPEMKQALRRHGHETDGQRDRVEVALQAFNKHRSTIKKGVLGSVGTMMALAHTPVQDGFLKGAYANHAFSNTEIAACSSLPAIDEATGETDLTAFQQFPKEATAPVGREPIGPNTRRDVELTTSGGRADR